MAKITVADALELSIEERIRLVGDIWDSIAECPEAVPLNEEDKRELDRRLAAYEVDPDGGSPWEDVKNRLLRDA